MRLRNRDMRLIRRLALLLAIAPIGAHGQVDVSQWPKVQLQIFVTGAKDGDVITGLDKSAVAVREDGKPQAVLNLESVFEPESICMLVDTSGSMYSRMADIRAAANHLLDALPPGDQICLASFGWHLEMRRHFTEDRAKIAASIQNLNAGGGTSLRDALIGLEDFMRGAAKHRLRTHRCSYRCR